MVDPILASIFGIFGNVVSFCVFLAPLPTFRRICHNKSTESFQCVPYLVSLFSCTLWILYALMKGEMDLLFSINAIGSLVQLIYISIFVVYASRVKRVSTIKMFISLNIFLYGLIVVLTVLLRFPLAVVGWVCVGVSISVFASPLMIVVQVIKTKSVEFMPFSLSLLLTITAVAWLAYGALIRDIYIAIPNVLGLAFGIGQMILYAFYRKKEHVGEIELIV